MRVDTMIEFSCSLSGNNNVPTLSLETEFGTAIVLICYLLTLLTLTSLKSE